MNKETLNHILSLIRSARNKKHWRVREFIAQVETLISEYRVTARRMKGTAVARYCNSEANYIEKRLDEAKGVQ